MEARNLVHLLGLRGGKDTKTRWSSPAKLNPVGPCINTVEPSLKIAPWLITRSDLQRANWTKGTVWSGQPVLLGFLPLSFFMSSTLFGRCLILSRSKISVCLDDEKWFGNSMDEHVPL